MLKNFKLKIILIFLIIGIIAITSFGLLSIYELKQLEVQSEEMVIVIEEKISIVSYVILIEIGVFTILSSIIGAIAIKKMISPIDKIIKSAEKIASGETIDVRYLNSEKEEAEVRRFGKSL